MNDLIYLILLLAFLSYVLKGVRLNDYDTYIHSAKWRRKRLEVLYRDNFKCTECGRTKQLHVHHLSYAHFGHERLYELTTLCKYCHASRHKKYK